jgi:hypothetical protein
MPSVCSLIHPPCSLANQNLFWLFPLCMPLCMPCWLNVHSARLVSSSGGSTVYTVALEVTGVHLMLYFPHSSGNRKNLLVFTWWNSCIPFLTEDGQRQFWSEANGMYLESGKWQHGCYHLVKKWISKYLQWVAEEFWRPVENWMVSIQFFKSPALQSEPRPIKPFGNSDLLRRSTRAYF